MIIQSLHHITLLVEDVARAERFYGGILGLEPIARFDARFPGLFYRCGAQEIHLIVSSRPLERSTLYLNLDGGGETHRRYVHRHLALVVSDWAEMQRRLRDGAVRIEFSEETIDPGDGFGLNLVKGWKSRYGRVPLFCTDPFDNLLELIPAAGA